MTEQPAGEPGAREAALQLSESGVERKLMTWRTGLSLMAAVVIVALAVWRAPVRWDHVWTAIRQADLKLYAGALAAYYLSYVVRAVRWRILLANTGEKVPGVPLLPIIITSYFVNCVVPAKMGDVYRAVLLRQRTAIGATKAFGTIIAERLLDLVVLMVLLAGAGAVTFHRRVPAPLVPYAIAGAALCVVGIAVLAVMRAGRGRRLLALLPERAVERYESFRHGTVHSFARLPALSGLTVAVWALEGTRLGLVVFALGDQGLLGPAQFLLVALVAALLTTVPFLPGGLGLVEAGMVGVLELVGGLDADRSAAIALLDRSISYGSLVGIGAVVFAVTHLRTAQQRAGVRSDP
jgi:uncharacterized protein (TIRG00374 family)